MEKVENFQQSILNVHANNSNYTWGLVTWNKRRWPLPLSTCYYMFWKLALVATALIDKLLMISKGEIFWGLCLQISWQRGRPFPLPTWHYLKFTLIFAASFDVGSAMQLHFWIFAPKVQFTAFLLLKLWILPCNFTAFQFFAQKVQIYCVWIFHAKILQIVAFEFFPQKKSRICRVRFPWRQLAAAAAGQY